jgi:RIO kinase 1
MKTPAGLQPLIDDGVIDEVIRSLKSGKEATIYVVRSGTRVRCAKVYRDMGQRSFQKRAQYQEGRKVRGSRQARAMSKSTRFGRKEQEAAWKNAEVDALYQLVAAGVRVPQPYGYFNDTLIMELVTDAEGHPAPRLGELDLTPEIAREYHRFLIRQIVRMLSVGLIHGDLSEFNVLVGPDGPVIIDLPQAVNAAGNNGAFAMLARDEAPVDTDNVLAVIDDARAERPSRIPWEATSSDLRHSRQTVDCQTFNSVCLAMFSKSRSVLNRVRPWRIHRWAINASMVPACTPARRQLFLRLAASM